MEQTLAIIIPIFLRAHSHLHL